MRKLLLLPLLIAPILIAYLLWPTQKPVEPIIAQEPPPTPVVEQKPTIEPPTVERLLELTNAERVKAGVKPLILDERLNASAQKKVDEMAIEGWDDTPHINDAGFNTGYYIPQFMPECRWFSENVLGDAVDVYSGFNNWMNSESHREAILDTRYEYVGFGVIKGLDQRGGFVAQHFCDLG
jgi:uncharacterized protein YkwD